MSSATSVLGARVRVGGKSRLRDLKQVGAAMLASRLGRTGTLPSFVIIGAQRAGTTALFNTLDHHPQVRRPIAKELQYLTLNHHRGQRWYSAHFPTAAPGEVTFEASPFYLFHPLAPARAAESLPGIRTIALLRDPVKRAYSHWQHSRMHGFETLSFVDALDAEPERLAAAADPTQLSRKAQFSLRHHSYLARGRYAEQVERWQRAVGPDRLHVVRSEDFFRDTDAVIARMTSFLGLNQVELPTPPRTNHWVDGPNELTPAVAERLRDQLAHDTTRLPALTGDPALAWW